MRFLSSISGLAVVLLGLLATAPAQARYRIPLMPPRHKEVAMAPQYWRSPRPAVRAESPPVGERPFKFGFELGLLARKNSSEGTALGMQWLYGGRLVADKMWRRWHFKPSLGYFNRSQGEAATSVSEHNFEAGLAILWDAMPSRQSTVLLGLSNRVDGLISSITILNSTDSVPLTFRYRAGPRIDLNIGIDRHSTVTIGAELPMEIPDLRLFTSFTAGYLFAF